MTWLSTWPHLGRPQYAEHPTESAAEDHARELVASGRAEVATVFEANGIRVPQTHATGPQSHEHPPMVPECHHDPVRPSESERP